MLAAGPRIRLLCARIPRSPLSVFGAKRHSCKCLSHREHSSHQLAPNLASSSAPSLVASFVKASVRTGHEFALVSACCKSCSTLFAGPNVMPLARYLCDAVARRFRKRIPISSALSGQGCRQRRRRRNKVVGTNFHTHQHRTNPARTGTRPEGIIFHGSIIIWLLRATRCQRNPTNHLALGTYMSHTSSQPSS